MRLAWIGLAAAASLFAASSAFAQSVSPWTKFCGAREDRGEHFCLTMSEVRRAPDRFVASVALIDKTASAKTLRVSLPLGREALRGTRVVVDGLAPLRNGRVSCERGVCMADFAVSASFIAAMKRARSIEIRALTRHTLPLASFAAAFDNPATAAAQAQRERAGFGRIRCAAASDLCAWKRVPDSIRPFEGGRIAPRRIPR
jgi:invasion protein IalB